MRVNVGQPLEIIMNNGDGGRKETLASFVNGMRACTSEEENCADISSTVSRRNDYIFDRGQFFRSNPSLASKVKQQFFPQWLPDEKPKTLSECKTKYVARYLEPSSSKTQISQAWVSR
jgi:hypothetical protein